MEQLGSDDFEYEDDGFIIQDDGLLEVDSDEFDAVIEEELSKFHQQQADKYAQLQASSPWVAVPLASPDPITQQLRIEEHQQHVHLQGGTCEPERSEYIPPPRPPALQQHLDGPFTATEYSPAVQHRPISAAAPIAGVSADALDSVRASQEGLTAVVSNASSGMQLDEDAEPAAHHLSSYSSEHEAGNQQHENATAAPAWEASGLQAEDPTVGECEYITEMPDDNPSPAAIEYDSESDTQKATEPAAVAAGFYEQQRSTEVSDSDNLNMPAAHTSEQRQAILQQSPAAAAGDAALLHDGVDSVDENPAVVDFAMADAGPADAEPEVPPCPAEHAATTHLAQSAEGFFLDNWQGCLVEDAVLHEPAHQEHFELYAAGSIKQQEAGDLQAASISDACAVPEATAATNMQPREPPASLHDEPAPVLALLRDVQPPAGAVEEPAGAGSAAVVGGAAYTDSSSAAAAVVQQDAQHGERQDWAEASEGSAACQAAIEQQPSALQPEVQLDAAFHDADDSELLPANVSAPESGLGAHLLEQDGQFCDPVAPANLQDDPAVPANLQEQQLQHESETSEQQVLELQWKVQQHQQTQPDEGDQPASDATLPLAQPEQAERPQPEDLLQQLYEQHEQPYDAETLSVSDSRQAATEGQAGGQGGAEGQQEAYQQQAPGCDELLPEPDSEQELLLDVEQHRHPQEAANVIPRSSGCEQQKPLSHTDAVDWMVLPGHGHSEHVQQYLGSSKEVEQACDWKQQHASTGELNTHAAATAELQVPEQHESVGSGASDALPQHEQLHQQLGDEYAEQQGVGELPEQQYDAYRLSQQATLPTDTSAADTDAGDLHDERQRAVGQDHKAAAGLLTAQTNPVLPCGQQYVKEQQEESKQSAAFEYQQQTGERQTEDVPPVQQQQQENEESGHYATAEHGSFMHRHDISTDEVGHSVHTGNSTVTPAASTAAPAALDAAELVLDKGPEDAAAADADDGFIYQDEDPHSSNCSSSPESPVETAADVGLGIRPLAAAAALQYARVSSSADGRGQGEYTGLAAAIDWYPRLSQQNAGQEHIISWPDGAAMSPPTAAAAATGAARSPALSPQPPPYAPHHGTRPVHSKTRPALGSPSPDMMARYDGQLFTATAAPVVGRLRPESAPARRALTPTKRHTSPMTQIRGLTLAEGHSKPAWVTGVACASQQQLAQAVHVYGQQAAAWGITVNSGMQLPSRPHTSHGYISSGRSTSRSRKSGWTQPAGFAARPGSHAWAAEAGNSSSSSGRHLVRPVSADSASRAAEGQLSARQQQQQWQDGRLQQQRPPSRSPASTSSTPRQCCDEIHSLSQAYGFKPRSLDAGDGVCSSDWQQQRWQNTAQPRTIPWDNSPVPLNTQNSMPIAAATQSYDVLSAAKAGSGKSAGHSALCSTAAGHSALLARPRTAGSAEAGSILREHPGFTPRVGRGSPSASVRGSSGSGSEVYLADLLQKIRQANNSCRKMDMRKVYRLGKGSSVTWQQQQIVVEVWGLTEDQEAEQTQLYSWQLKGCLTLQQFDKQCEKIAAKVLEIEAAAAVAGAQEVLVVDSTSGSSGSSPDWARPDTHAAAAVAGSTVRQA